MSARNSLMGALLGYDELPRNTLLDMMRAKTLSDPTATANFLGEKALDKDWAAVTLARQMVDEGASRDDIWQATGQRGQPQWFDHGRWWHEAMGPSVADYRHPLTGKDYRRLPDVLPGDQAHAAYPHLKGALVGHRGDLSGANGPLAGAVPADLLGRPTIVTYPNFAAEDPLTQSRTLVHEQQHLIDAAEGVPVDLSARYLDRPTERRGYNAEARRAYLTDDQRRQIPPYETDLRAMEDAAYPGQWAATLPTDGLAAWAAKARQVEQSPLPPKPYDKLPMPPTGLESLLRRFLPER